MKNLLASVALAGLCTSVRGQIPQTISHQGVVTVNGQRWTGMGKFRFALVDSNGVYRWSNDDNEAPISPPQTDVSATVVDGVYSVILGGDGPQGTGGKYIPSNAISKGDARLRIWFNDGSHGFQQLADDQLFASVPYAFNGVPPGTIVAYGGVNAPVGWLLCDGRSLRQADYPGLYAAISDNWGGANDPNLFNLPDLRGFFLRGVDTPAGTSEPAVNRDNDHGSRFAIKAGGNSGDAVGTYQGDAYQMHAHASTVPRPAEDKNNNYNTYSPVQGFHAYTWQLPPDSQNTGQSGGNETRPENASVLYIIKY